MNYFSKSSTATESERPFIERLNDEWLKKMWGV